MKLSEFVKKIFKDFLLIFALIIIILTFLRQMYFPDEAFSLKSIYIIMAFAFLSALIGFILYSPNDLSEKNMRIRMFLHFFTLEILLIAISSVFGVIESLSDGIILAVQIAVIYFIVRFLSWKKDQKEAQKINEKLNAWKKDVPQ
ncbi:DUF3021 family protein [Neobacillus rhizosphaerae]|uniref:DUF3021 family protein n=1 Tax=Neobacillus rhizosphaerae TaxID=2880965 RepID=UPI003D276754